MNYTCCVTWFAVAKSSATSDRLVLGKLVIPGDRANPIGQRVGSRKAKTVTAVWAEADAARRCAMHFSSCLAKSVLSLLLSECLILNAAVTPTLSAPTPNRAPSRNGRPARSRSGPRLSSLLGGREGTSATPPVTVAAGPNGSAPREWKTGDSATPLTRIERPVDRSASPQSLSSLANSSLVTKSPVARATFVENKGQWDARVRFQLKSGGK